MARGLSTRRRSSAATLERGLGGMDNAASIVVCPQMTHVDWTGAGESHKRPTNVDDSVVPIDGRSGSNHYGASHTEKLWPT